MTVGSLFSGCGGLDKGLEDAGMRVLWQVEQNRYAREILTRHWPSLPLHSDIRDRAVYEAPSVDLVAGGDPCPKRSKARGDRPSNSPDLSGYFLAVVGRLRPRWVVRENVPAPDVSHFAACLELLGYGVVAIELDARDFTGQSRRRQFLIGCPPAKRSELRRVVFDAACGFGFSASSQGEETPVAACLTAHSNRMAAEDSYCFEPGRGLRILTPEERESLQGFPRGWTAGLSPSRRAVLTGNAVCVPVARWIGHRIMEAAR